MTLWPSGESSFPHLADHRRSADPASSSARSVLPSAGLLDDVATLLERDQEALGLSDITP